MLGSKEMKTDLHGASNPILIKILLPKGDFDTAEIEQFLFTDIQYIVQQIYSFSYLSWRSFLPVEQPATMLYSNLISDLLGRLRTINGWKPEVRILEKLFWALIVLGESFLGCLTIRASILS
jgi:hypothetical protein